MDLLQIGLNRQLCTSLPPTDLVRHPRHCELLLVAQSLLLQAWICVSLQVCEVEAPDCYVGKYLPSGQLLVRGS